MFTRLYPKSMASSMAVQYPLTEETDIDSVELMDKVEHVQYFSELKTSSWDAMIEN